MPSAVVASKTASECRPTDCNRRRLPGNGVFGSAMAQIFAFNTSEQPE
jgi:hypothetical protein